MTIHEGITISNADQLYGLLKQGVEFHDCNFDEADLMDIEAEELVLQNCSLRGTRLSNLVCERLRAADSNMENAYFEKAQLYEAEFTNCLK